MRLFRDDSLLQELFDPSFWIQKKKPNFLIFFSLWTGNNETKF